MYAIINTGGKQAKVRAGDVVNVELLKSDDDTDETIELQPILVVDGDSVISDASALAKLPVSVKILGETKGEKIDIFKYKNKTGYRRRMGHRQRYTQVEVVSIGSAKRDSKQSEPEQSADEEE